MAAQRDVSLRELTVIRRCDDRDVGAILAIINAAAQAYRGVIPEDRWKEPYMPRAELTEGLDGGVAFWGYDIGGELVGVMGMQDVRDVRLIRHAYVRPESQRQGIGSLLLDHLRRQTDQPVLIGTWADAAWAIRFYQKHDFRLVTQEEKGRLLRTYWSISERQIETSVVLADHRWFDDT
jgi:GNAT superfamily N-acetyltransferase